MGTEGRMMVKKKNIYIKIVIFIYLQILQYYRGTHFCDGTVDRITKKVKTLMYLLTPMNIICKKLLRGHSGQNDG